MKWAGTAILLSLSMLWTVFALPVYTDLHGWWRLSIPWVSHGAFYWAVALVLAAASAILLIGSFIFAVRHAYEFSLSSVNFTTWDALGSVMAPLGRILWVPIIGGPILAALSISISETSVLTLLACALASGLLVKNIEKCHRDGVLDLGGPAELSFYYLVALAAVTLALALSSVSVEPHPFWQVMLVLGALLVMLRRNKDMAGGRIGDGLPDLTGSGFGPAGSLRLDPIRGPGRLPPSPDLGRRRPLDELH